MTDMLNRFNQIFKELDDAYRRVARASGLSECALWILYFLRENSQPLTQRQLCERMLQPKQSVNTALKKMEADGWITLVPFPTDRRSRLVALSPAGLEAARMTADRILAAERAAFDCFAPEEAQTYLALLERHKNALTAGLEQLFEGDKP